MSRAEHEAAEARSRNHSAPEMRRLGFWSALCPDDPSGWQTFGIPPQSTRKQHEDTLRQFKYPVDLKPQRYGEAGA